MPMRIERKVTSIGSSNAITLPKGAMLGRDVVIYLNRVGIIIPKDIHDGYPPDVIGEVYELLQDIQKELMKNVVPKGEKTT